MSSPLLLDTHYWIWIAFGNLEELSSRTKSLIEDYGRRGELLLSAISVWELGMLERKKRLNLDIPIEDWVRDALAIPGLTVAPISAEIALAASRLPGDFHGDRADRIIIATARGSQAQLLTKDRAMLEYAKQSYVRAL